MCIHGVKKERMWNFCGSRIGEVEEYKYLGVTVKAGLNGCFKSMGDRMVDANGVLGMVKYAATRSGSKYVVGREGWKSMVVNKMMYGCGTLAWNQHECDDLEVRQNGMGRWLWDVGNVRNELIRGETGWSTFKEREAKAMVKWMLSLQTTQPTSGGAVTVVSSCCANCVEPPRPQQWGPDLPFFGHAGHADPLDGWRCCSQKRVMSRPIQVRQL